MSVKRNDSQPVDNFENFALIKMIIRRHERVTKRRYDFLRPRVNSSRTVSEENKGTRKFIGVTRNNEQRFASNFSKFCARSQ
jgi:hypothetical protein